MANTRQPKRPQMDYYEFKRLREERLRARGISEEPSEEAFEEPNPSPRNAPEDERRSGFGAKAFGALSGIGSKLKNAASGGKKDDFFEEDDADPYLDDQNEQAAPETDASDPGADFAVPPKAEAEGEAAPEEPEAPLSAPDTEKPSEADAPDAEQAADVPATEQAADVPATEQAADVPEAEQPAWDDGEEEYEPEPEEDSDGNEDNPFSAFLRTAKIVGGKAKDLFGKLKGRRGEREEDEPEDAEEPREDADMDEEPSPEDAFDPDTPDTPARPENGAVNEYIAFEADAPEADGAQKSGAEPIADIAPETDVAEKRDMFFEDEEEEEEAGKQKGGILDRFKALFARKPKAAEDTDEDEEEFQTRTEPEFEKAPAERHLAQRTQRFLPMDDEDDELNFAAADAPADKEEPHMNEQNPNKTGSLSELLAKELDDAPALSRRERKALEASRAGSVAADAGRHSLTSVDEPTMEFTPVRARDTASNMKPVAVSEPEEEEEELEAPKPARKGLFGRPRKKIEEEEYEDEDEEEEEDDVRPAKRASKPSRYYDEDEDDEEEEEDDEEIVRPRHGKAKPERRSRYDDYDDEDDEDDEEDDDYDDDYDEDKPSFAKGLLRFLRNLLIFVIIGALILLGLRELDNRDILSLDSLRGIKGGVGSVMETIFPDPDGKTGEPDLQPSGSENG